MHARLSVRVFGLLTTVGQLIVPSQAGSQLRSRGSLKLREERKAQQRGDCCSVVGTCLPLTQGRDMRRARVKSSSIISVGYNETNGILEIEFDRGRIYQYFDVPRAVYDELLK